MKKLIINREIYSDKTIYETIDAYKKIAAITIKYKKNIAEIVFWKSKYDEVLTVREFENYMIGLENSL